MPVKFVNLGESNLVPTCSLTSDESVSNDTIYGYFDENLEKIFINQNLLKYIEKDQGSQVSFKCSHRNMHRLSLAVLIHEASHLYDLSNFRTEGEKKLFKSCHDFKGDQSCAYIKKNYRRKTTVSTQLKFKKLAKWSFEKTGGQSRNKKPLSSPDIYEKKSVEEYFAVNMEYYLLDMDYERKRPYHAQFLNRHFKLKRKIDDSTIFSSIPVFKGKKTLRFLPSSIRSISYLLASSGRTLGSGWGHSLLRLKGCQRKIPSNKKCSLNDKIDLVIAYSADLENKKINPIKGLIGSYPSRMNIYLFEDILKKYSILENRTLNDYPLHLSQVELKNLVYGVLEDYWSYQGSYKFLGVNCATELRNLLQTTLDNPVFLLSKTKTPYGLLKSLIKSKIILLDQNRKDYLSYSKKVTFYLKRLYKKIHGKLDKREEDFFLKLSAKERRSQYKKWFDQMNDTDLEFYSDLLKLEAIFLNKSTLDLEQLFLYEISLLMKKKTQLNTVESKLLSSLKSLETKLKLRRPNYGIPLKLNFEPVLNRLKVHSKFTKDFARSLHAKGFFTSENKEILEVEQNIDFLEQIILSSLFI